MRRLVSLLVLVLTAFLVAGCRVDADTLVKVNADGSGKVTVSVVLDREAATKLGDPKKAIKLDDLTQAGWAVDGPTVDTRTGEVKVEAVREFASPGELPPILEEVGGGSANGAGVFSNVKLEISPGFASTSYKLQGEVSLSGSLEQFSDPELKKALGGLALGRTPEQLATEGAGSDSVEWSVTFDLPGTTQRSNGQSVDGRTRWILHPDSGKASRASLSLTTKESQRGVTAMIGFGVALVVVGAGFAGVALKRSR